MASKDKSTILPLIRDDDSQRKNKDRHCQRNFVTNVFVQHYCASTVVIAVLVFIMIYTTLPSEEVMAMARASLEIAGIQGAVPRGNTERRRPAYEPPAAPYDPGGEYSRYHVAPDAVFPANFGSELELETDPLSEGGVRDSTYKFRSRLDLTQLRHSKSYVFYHPREGKLGGMTQKRLADYHLCCTFYNGAAEGPEELLPNTKMCGNSDKFQCAIEDNRLRITVDAASLGDTSLFSEVVSVCMINWSTHK